MSKWQAFWNGSILMLPLSIAVIPWGILAGSVAVDAGLTVWQSQGLSLLVFAGAAQLIASAMIKAGASLGAILLTTFIVTARHFLYSMAMRQDIKHLPLRWRMSLGFLLTDELFAIASLLKDSKTNTHSPVNASMPSGFNRWCALGAGLSFYIIWNIATLAGILVGSVFPDLDTLGLDFAIVGTFIAITVPSIVNLSTAVSVVVALVLSVALQMLQVEGSLLIASLLAMACGFFVAKWRKESV